MEYALLLHHIGCSVLSACLDGAASQGMRVTAPIFVTRSHTLTRRERSDYADARATQRDLTRCVAVLSQDDAMRRVKRTKRRHRAGLRWTTGEEELLCELYPTHNNRDLAARFGRSEWAISGKARALGLVRDHGGSYRRQQSEGGPWSHREIELLRMLYPVMPYEAIGEKIGRSHDAVKMKARKLKLRKIEFWSEQEDQLLRDSHQGRSYNGLAQRLGRTVLAVKARAITLGLEAKVPKWTRDEIEFLRNSYAEIDLDVIARELGRTRAATAKKAREIGLVQYRHWSREDVQKLTELYPHHTACELAGTLRHSPEAIRYKAKQLGLRKRPEATEPSEISS